VTAGTSIVPESVDLAVTSHDSPSFLAVIREKLCKWSVQGKETGIDRIWLELDEAAMEIHVSGVQIKTGCDTIKFTAGNLNTQRANKTCARCDGRAIAGVLVKAERGFAVLVEALEGWFVGYRVVVDSLVICTNKQASDAFRSFFSASSYQFQAASPKVGFFSCQLFDGIIR